MPQPNQKVERECSLCGKMRGLYDFSASQRRKGDDAACLKCIPEIQNVKPGQVKHVMDTSDAKYVAQHTGTTNSTTGSLLNKSGGVRLPTSLTASAMTAGSGKVTVTSTRTTAATVNGASSSVATSSRVSCATNGNDATASWTVKETGWIQVPNEFREEPVPDLADDDVETFNDDSDGDDWDM